MTLPSWKVTTTPTEPTSFPMETTNSSWRTGTAQHDSDLAYLAARRDVAGKSRWEFMGCSSYPYNVKNYGNKNIIWEKMGQKTWTTDNSQLKKRKLVLANTQNVQLHLQLKWEQNTAPPSRLHTLSTLKSTHKVLWGSGALAHCWWECTRSSGRDLTRTPKPLYMPYFWLSDNITMNLP